MSELSKETRLSITSKIGDQPVELHVDFQPGVPGSSLVITNLMPNGETQAVVVSDQEAVLAFQQAAAQVARITAIARDVYAAGPAAQGAAN